MKSWKPRRDLLPLRVGQGRGELGQPRLVVIDPEDELDDRRHRRAGLRLHARFLEQLGIFLWTLLRRDREVICQRQSAIERSARAALAGLDRLRGLARSPQTVGETGILVEHHLGTASSESSSESGPSSHAKWAARLRRLLLGTRQRRAAFGSPEGPSSPCWMIFEFERDSASIATDSSISVSTACPRISSGMSSIASRLVVGSRSERPCRVGGFARRVFQLMTP